MRMRLRTLIVLRLALNTLLAVVALGLTTNFPVGHFQEWDHDTTWASAQTTEGALP